MDRPAILIGSINGTPLEQVWAGLSPRGLVAVDFGVSQTNFEHAVRRQTKSEIEYAPRQVEAVVRQIQEYLMGRRRTFDLAIDWSVLSSGFQREALRAVFSIPYGRTRTYAEIAQQIGHPQAFRAVGRANATNPMPLVIPCHRLIGSDGKLHGYGGKGGLKTKAWLLKMERENR
ncbi:MAG TPA: methylated-DNA--[protein]-cysteine S-methyltransferase [Anaerolineales bacterium]|nr:methylated-DNA--[protein]-cysteine S-methyltransferase [Anaerolineales bacterium]